MTFSELVVGLCVLAAPIAAWSHGDWPPKHGGLMNEGGETSFELVQKPEGIHFYVSDHGEVMETADSKATLTVINSKHTQTFDGTTPGKGMLYFQNASAKPGDQVILKVQFRAGSIAIGRYLMLNKSKKPSN